MTAEPEGSSARVAIETGFACRICGNRQANREHLAREMMFGTREEFPYLECGACGCLQIREIPADMAPYYPSDRYHAAPEPELVATTPVKQFLREQRADYCLYGRNLVGALLCRLMGVPEFYSQTLPWYRTARLRRDDRVLDVGCGAGYLLLTMRSQGFRRLEGIDPFIPEDIHYPGGVTVHKRHLHEMEGSYDFLVMHHAFEHVPGPRETLAHLHRLLRRGKYALIRIPVVPNHAWQTYGVDWVQLDAPRHLHLHSVKSMRGLAEEAGFRIDQVAYDSTSMQFSGSERYRRGIPLKSPEKIDWGAERVAAWKQQAEELNSRGEGDQACFYLYKP